MHGEKVADLPVQPLSEESPCYDRPHTPTPKQPAIAIESLTPPQSILETLETLLATPDLCSKRWIWEQYDSLTRYYAILVIIEL